MSEQNKRKRGANKPPAHEFSQLEIVAWYFVGAVMAATEGKKQQKRGERHE